MSSVLGVDKNTIDRVCHGKWSFEVKDIPNLIPDGASIPLRCKVHLTDGKADVLSSKNTDPTFTINNFGRGKGIYLSTFETSVLNNRLLLNILMYVACIPMDTNYITDNAYTECAYFPSDKKLIIINNSDRKQTTTVKTENGLVEFKDIEPFDTIIKQL